MNVLNDITGVAEELRRLEESLWRSESRYDRKLMESRFAADFFEFGRSGKIYRREELLFDPEDAGPIVATLPLPRLSVRELASDTYQVTYLSEVSRQGGVDRANRSSIWSRTPSGWQLRFHQGTPC